MKPSDLIKTGWCQGAFARTTSGQPTDPTSPDAACFCLRGAIMKAALTQRALTFYDMIGQVNERLNTNHITGWNDAPERTKEEVIKVLEDVGL